MTTKKPPNPKPCPFCGGRKIKDAGVFGYFMLCCGCRCIGPPRKTERAAINAWNRRAKGKRK